MSTAGLFQPSRDDGRADWRVVFDLLERLQPGDEIGHDILMGALDTDSRSRMYRAVQRANKELWATRDRSVAVVKGVGYRMLHAWEHEAQANLYQRQSRKKLSNAVAVIDAADLDQLSDQQREWMVKVQSGMHLLARAMDSHAKRLAGHDEMIRKLQEDVEDLKRAKE